jgi:hypothetical protein
MLFHSFAFSAFRSSFALVAAAIVPHHGEKAYTNRQYFMEPIRVSEMAQEILLLFRFAFFFPNKRIVNYSGFFFRTRFVVDGGCGCGTVPPRPALRFSGVRKKTESENFSFRLPSFSHALAVCF